MNEEYVYTNDNMLIGSGAGQANSTKTGEITEIFIAANHPVSIYWTCEREHTHRRRFMAILCNYFSEVMK